MENSSDKQLRDKLSGTEFPFDPQAWEQMEAMLDKKKKRRGFFWWWTSGVAAVFLLAISSYSVREVLVGKQKLATVKSSSKERNTSVNDVVKSEENTRAVVGNGTRSELVLENLPITNNQRQLASAKSEIRNQNLKTNTTANGKLKRLKGNSSTAPISSNQSNQSHPFKKAFSIGKKQLHKNKKQETANKKPSTPIQQEVEMLNTASATASAEENISLSRREASLLAYVSENATNSFDKKEEDVLPKKKKKIFNYSLGVLANITGTTLGNQTSSGSIRNRPAPFYKTPSFMVGLTHDFLFINRIAITNSILFSQTSFQVYQPKTVSFTVAPANYTSQITELAIPIGIKVYPVVKNNFRFYINTGIINHIVLKEKLSYSSVANPIANVADSSMFPNSFVATGLQNGTKDFSINSAKRYYASFYAGAGFEYVAKKHFIVFGEPMFYMSLQKIGVQDKHKYNLGLTSGFRYQF